MHNKKQLAMMLAMTPKPSKQEKIAVEPHDDAPIKLSVDDSNKMKVDTSDLKKQLAIMQRSIASLLKNKTASRCIVGVRFTLDKNTVLCNWGEQKIESSNFGKYDGTLSITFPNELPTTDYGIRITSSLPGVVVGYSNASKTGLTLVCGSKSVTTSLEVNLEIMQ